MATRKDTEAPARSPEPTYILPQHFRRHVEYRNPFQLCACIGCLPRIWCVNCLDESDFYLENYQKLSAALDDSIEKYPRKKQFVRQEFQKALRELLDKTMLYGDGEPRTVGKYHGRGSPSLCELHNAVLESGMPAGTPVSTYRAPGQLELVAKLAGVDIGEVGKGF